MLNRRVLRAKVLQAVYAYVESGEENVEVGVKYLLESIDKLYELFIWQLSFLVETKRFAERRIDENKHKHIPTPEDLNPNMRYVNNRVLLAIEDNKEFRKKETALKINWADDQDIVRKYYNLMRSTPEYLAYMDTENDSFSNDKAFLISMVENYFSDLEVLQDYYGEKSIFFVDDYHFVTSMLQRFLSDIKQDFGIDSHLPAIYRTERNEVNEDKEFVKDLFRQTIKNSDEYGRLIGKNISNWEKERVCVMDMIILKMALAEMLCFHEIPVKVSINEYIELSKYFSTPKSKIFVNGILDRLMNQLNEENKIVKKGVGLLDK